MGTSSPQIFSLKDVESPFHQQWNFWYKKHLMSSMMKKRNHSNESNASYGLAIPEDSLVREDDWGAWKQCSEKLLEDGVHRRHFSRTISKQKSLVVMRGQTFAAPKTDPDEKYVQDNLGTLNATIIELKAAYKKYNDSHFQEGRMIAILNDSGMISDWNYHIFPYVVEPGRTIPDLFEEEIFESWWKTDEIWKEMLRANSSLKAFADLSVPIPQNVPIKKVPGTLEYLGFSSKNNSQSVLMEFVILLNEEGEFSYCMIAFYDDILLGNIISLSQERIILKTLNRLNETGTCWKGRKKLSDLLNNFKSKNLHSNPETVDKTWKNPELSSFKIPNKSEQRIRIHNIAKSIIDNIDSEDFENDSDSNNSSIHNRSASVGNCIKNYNNNNNNNNNSFKRKFNNCDNEKLSSDVSENKENNSSGDHNSNRPTNTIKNACNGKNHNGYNTINNSHGSNGNTSKSVNNFPFVSAENDYPKSLNRYRIKSTVITPLLFKYLEWAKETKKITKSQFIKKYKFAMGMALPYLQTLQEQAMSPLSLGLRALLQPVDIK